MKKILAVFLILCLNIAVFASGFDFGGMVSTSSYNQTPVSEMSFSQYVDTSLWFKAKLGDSSYLSGDVLYSCDFDFPKKGETEMTIAQLLNVPSFKFSTVASMGETGSFKFNLGRFNLSDLSGAVISQSQDGMEMIFRVGQSSIFNVYGGYTGFLNAYANAMYSPKFVAEETPFYSLACPYIVAGFSAKFPSLFAGQSVGLDFNSATDAKDFEYNRLYGGISIDGPIYKSLYYALTSTAQVNLPNAVYDLSIENLTKGEISLFLPWCSMVLGANVMYTTNTFTSITNFNASIDGEPLTSVLTTGLIASIKPCNWFFTSINGKALFDVNESNLVENYRGVQYEGTLRFQIFDDMLASLSVSQIFYNKDIPDYKNRDSYLTMKAHIRISF